LLKCDLGEDDTQAPIKHLTGFNEKIAPVIELYPHTTQDDVSPLAYKAKVQRNIKEKEEISKPSSRAYPF